MDLESKTSSINGRGRNTADEIKTCHFSPHNITPNVPKWTLLESNKNREKDRMYYEWPDNNFQGVDKISSHCGPMFAQWSNADALSWFSSSSNDIISHDDTFTSSLESSCSDVNTFNDASTCANISSLIESTAPEADNDCHFHTTCHSKDSGCFKVVTRTEQAYDGGEGIPHSTVAEVSNEFIFDEYEFEPLQINIQKQQLDSQYPSQVAGKGLESCFSERLPLQNCSLSPESSSYKNPFCSYNQSGSEFLYQNLFFQTASVSGRESDQIPSTSHEVSAHDIINKSYCMDNLPDSSFKTPVIKLNEAVEAQSLRTSEVPNLALKQHDNLEQETGCQRGKIGIDLHKEILGCVRETNSFIPSMSFDDTFFKAISFQQFHDVIVQLDLKTKLCIRDSLYRLAGFTESRDTFATEYNENAEFKRGSREFSEYMNMQTETCSFDQSLALVLFAVEPHYQPRRHIV